MSILKWFYRVIEEGTEASNSPENEGVFILKIGELVIGVLSVRNGYWHFKYSKEFKQQNKYSRLIGFSDLDKTYESEVLWPFFKLRIPGLKQPLIKEILEKEEIDVNDEVSLLRRFGRKNISNPYILEPA